MINCMGALMAVSRVFNNSGGTLPDSGGGGSEITENLTTQVNGARTQFTVSSRYISGRLRVYINGVRQIIGDDITQSADRMSFSISYAPLEGEKLIVDYESDS